MDDQFEIGLNKALWPLGGDSAVGEHLFAGAISWPALVLSDAALRHNIASLAGFCRRHGLAFAPHGKTTMAPALFRRQLDAGAWGITVATGQQVAVARAAGIARILLAHEVLDPAALDWVAAELRRDPAFEFACFVDSVEGVAAAARAGRAHGLSLGFPLILDLGFAGGRTGVRTAGQARALAETIDATDGVRLVGVNGYEGGLPDLAAVTQLFAFVRSVVDDLAAASVLPARPIVTAGGSAYFDAVAAELGGDWSRRRGALVILRSGAYISHDDGIYADKTAFRRIPDEGDLLPALRIWAQVVSAPEPGLVLVGMGKRDAPYDDGLPVPLSWRVTGGDEVDVRDRLTVTKLDDQHCYVTTSPGAEPRPGDLIGFGISHPCTAFDKWRAVPIVDDDNVIVDVARTYF